MLFFYKKGNVEVKNVKKTLDSNKTTLWAQNKHFSRMLFFSDKNIVKSNFVSEFVAWKEQYLKMRVDKCLL